MDYKSVLKLALPNPVETLKSQVDILKGHEVNPIEESSTYVRYHMEYGDLIIDVTPEGWAITVIGETEFGLEILKNYIVEHILEYYEGISEDVLIWSGYENTAQYLTNFRLVEIIAKTEIEPNMFRFTVKGENLSTYVEGGLHFQLLIPTNPNLPPVWPTKKQSGKIHFPVASNDQEQGVSRRVYTIRHIRPEQGEFDFDLLRHEGGVASDWAEIASIGEKIGVLGPSGGRAPKADWLMLAGDETALPAIARILEDAPAHTEGEVFIELKDCEKWQVDLKKPEGIKLQWLDQKDNQLVDKIESISAPEDKSIYYWFGGEFEVAAQLRKYLKQDLKLASKQYHSSAYWRKG